MFGTPSINRARLFIFTEAGLGSVAESYVNSLKPIINESLCLLISYLSIRDYGHRKTMCIHH
jgi:hypothetical protein